MPTSKKSRATLLDYYPAQIHKTKKCTYVGYHVRNPLTGSFVRKRIKINWIKNSRERLMYGRRLVIELNSKLSQGWNPFVEQEAPRSFSLLSETVEKYLVLKTKELRIDSIRSYSNILNSFNSWSERYFKSSVYILNISILHAQNYLNELYLGYKGSANKYNNHKAVLRAFWTWLVENGYSKVNIFKGIRSKKETPKKRVFIEENIRKQIFNYFKKNEQYIYLAICYLTFYGLIRPKEICMLKPADFDFNYNIITIPASVSKTRKERIVTMPKPLKEMLLKINIPKVKADFYVFGKGLVPNTEMTNRLYIAKFWAIMRDDLGLKKEIQYYSLKDTGIVELLRAGVSPEAVRDQAGHSSLEMTNRYVKIARTNADNQILNKVNF